MITTERYEAMEEDDTLSKRTGKECPKRIVDAKSDKMFY